MDATERAALLAELVKDIRAFQEELRGIDRHASQEAKERHRALTDQIISMRHTQRQLEGDVED